MVMNIPEENIIDGLTLVNTKNVPSDISSTIRNAIADYKDKLSVGFYVGKKAIDEGSTDHFVAVKLTRKENNKTINKFALAEINITKVQVTDEETGELKDQLQGTLKGLRESFDFNVNPGLRNVFDSITSKNKRFVYTPIWLFGIVDKEFYVLTNVQSTMRGMKPVLSIIKFNQDSETMTSSDITAF